MVTELAGWSRPAACVKMRGRWVIRRYRAGMFVYNESGSAGSSGVWRRGPPIASLTVIEQLEWPSPEQACAKLPPIVKRDPAKAKDIQVGFLALSKKGEVGAFAIAKGFTFAVSNSDWPKGKVFAAKSHY